MYQRTVAFFVGRHDPGGTLVLFFVFPQQTNQEFRCVSADAAWCKAPLELRSLGRKLLAALLRVHLGGKTQYFLRVIGGTSRSTPCAKAAVAAV